MKELPHHYTVEAEAEAEGPVAVRAERLPTLQTAPPAEFGGPGDQWSPETLLLAAVADCFILTFRAVAHASKLSWHSLGCRAEGVLDRVERRTRFTEVIVRASLRVPADVDPERARRLLEKAERSCLVTNSLVAECRLEASVETAG
jgi:peroxiredoxin-like protein